jgi:hypothetical protein
MMMKRIVCLFAFATMAVAAHASADSCKSAKVKIVNDRGESIKIAKIQYFDYCQKKWRDENVPNTEILGADGSTHHYAELVQNLEYVEGCPITKFKLYRAVRQDKGSAYGSYTWGEELVPDEGTNQKCYTDTRFTIHAKD